MRRRRWIRVDVTYEHREWLAGIPGSARRLFPSFLIYLKKNGVRGGAERIPPEAMAREMECPVEDWLALINAAVASGAVIIDDQGDWFYVAWEDEQEVSTERVQKYRAKARNETDETVS
jgi:hypothetical protein